MERRELSTYQTERITEALHIRHEAYLQKGERFEVSGYVSQDEVYTKMVLHNEDDTFYYPVECRIDPIHAGIDKVDEALDLLLDFQDYYFGRYFAEDRDIFLSIDWAEYDFEDTKLQAKGQIFNRQLEQIADDLLNEPPN